VRMSINRYRKKSRETGHVLVRRNLLPLSRKL
jgi:hypothetical protein